MVSHPIETLTAQTIIVPNVFVESEYIADTFFVKTSEFQFRRH